MSRKDNIQGLLKDRFQNFEAEPQKDLWKGIEGELYPSKKKAIKLWPYISVAASIIILAFSWIYLNTSTEGELPIREGIAEESIEQPNEQSLIPEKELVDLPLAESSEKAEQEPASRNEGSTKTEQQLQAPMLKKPFAPLAKAETRAEEMLPQEDLMDKAVALSVESSQQNTLKEPIEKVVIDPLAKELIAMNVETVEQSQPTFIPVSKTSTKTADFEEENTDRSLRLKDLSFNKIVSMASNGIDKLKNASPVKVYEEKTEKGESKVYQLNLFKFSVSHKTQKRRNKKVRL